MITLSNYPIGATVALTDGATGIVRDNAGTMLTVELPDTWRVRYVRQSDATVIAPPPMLTVADLPRGTMFVTSDGRHGIVRGTIGTLIDVDIFRDGGSAHLRVPVSDIAGITCRATDSDTEGSN